MNKEPRYFIFPAEFTTGIQPEFRHKLTDTLLKNAKGGFDIIVDLQEKKMFYMGEWKKVRSG